MDSRAERRSGAGWLAALTVVALAVGAGWWTASAPPDTPGAAMAPHADAVVRGTAGVTVTGPESFRVDGGARVVAVEPDTGRIAAPSGSRITVDAQPGRVPWVGPGRPEAGVSRVGTVVWRENRLLTEQDRQLRRQSFAERGTRYQLLLLCDGDGDLLVRLGSGGLWHGRLISSCDGTLNSIGVTGVGGPLSVRISHRQQGRTGVTALLVALD